MKTLRLAALAMGLSVIFLGTAVGTEKDADKEQVV